MITPPKINVLVVDDSAFMRKIITDLVNSDPQLSVVGTARHGKDALQKIEQLKPDVCTLDVEMPVMDGLTALKEIKKNNPIPIIMVSSTTVQGAENTLLALERGAFDFIPKPSGPISLDMHQVKTELIQKIKLAYRQRFPSSTVKQTSVYSKQTSVRLGLRRMAKKIKTDSVILKGNVQRLVLIGTSTGGPKALRYLFTKLPYDAQTALLVVQHMPPTFTKSLAARLNLTSAYRVKEGENREVVEGGTIYIAPGGYHMALDAKESTLRLHIHAEDVRVGHRPSVDVLYESAVHIGDVPLMTVTLTGMGKDGTAGLKTLTARKRVFNVAEDATSCVVYGMPKSVIDEGLAHEIAPLDKIGDILKQFITL